MRIITLALLASFALYGQSTRVAVGRATPYTDSAGYVWAADTSTCTGTTISTSQTILGTVDPTLYQGGRRDNLSMGCTGSIDTGVYRVSFKFAEIRGLTSGQQIFNIYLNNTVVRLGFDIRAYAPAATAYDVVIPAFAILEGSYAIYITQQTGGVQLNAFALELVGPGLAPYSGVATDGANGLTVQGRVSVGDGYVSTSSDAFHGGVKQQSSEPTTAPVCYPNCTTSFYFRGNQLCRKVWTASNAGIETCDPLNVIAFGASPLLTSADAAVAINLATTAACASRGPGAAVYIPPGRYRVKTPIVAPCPGVMLYGENPGGGPGTVFYGSSLVADATHTGPVVRFDPADWDAGAAFLRGVGLRDLQIDLTNATTIRAIEYKSVSNSPINQNVSIVGLPTSTVIFQGMSANVGAQISEGITWDGIHIYGGIATAAQWIIEHSNEIAIRNSKILCSAACAAGTGLLIRSGASAPVYGVELIGNSFASQALALSVSGPAAGPHTAPRWVWVLHNTFESVVDAIKFNGTAATSVQHATVLGNRFYTVTGTDLICDYCSANQFWIGGDALAVSLTANSTNNEVYARPTIVTDSGTGNMVYGWVSGGLLEAHKGMGASNGANPQMYTTDTRAGGVKTKIQSLGGTPAGQVGTETTHDMNLISNNTSRMLCKGDGSYCQFAIPLLLQNKAFANLGTPAVGTVVYCTDCTIGNPCVGAGTGSWAFRVAGPAWNCAF